jgi:hypothetical protein
MPLLALSGVLVSGTAMVIYSPPSIKMGFGGINTNATSLLRQPEDQKERAVELFGRFSVDVANNPSNAVTAERDQFIGHDLRPEAKTVFRCNFNQRSE